MAAGSWTGARVQAPGAELHVVLAGPPDGEPLILLHGFPEHWWGWRKQISGFVSAGFRVIVPDLRGYGQSAAPEGTSSYRIDILVADVLAVADVNAAGRFTLVGHDWGGVIAWAAAARHPERIDRLVVLNAPHLDVYSAVAVRHPTQLLRSAYVGFFQLPRLSEAALKARNFLVLRHLLLRSSRPGTFTPTDLDCYALEWARPGRLTAMLNYYRALVRFGHAPLGRIAPPTLILWGKRDSALRYELAEASLEQCEDGQLITFPDATHWLQLEQPDEVLRAVAGFVPGARPLG